MSTLKLHIGELEKFDRENFLERIRDVRQAEKQYVHGAQA